MTFLAVEAEPGEFPEIVLEDLFEFPALLFDGTNFAFNRVGLLYLLAAAIVIWLMLAAFRRGKVVPGRFQAAMEALVDLVRNNIIIEVIGTRGLRYLPLLTAMFLFILVGNLFEITPLINMPANGRMAMPAFLAIMVWTVFIVAGLREHGIGYFKAALVPSGVPKPVLVLLIPIELVSTFIVRPLTLAVRLFANMMAGHILVAVAFLATNAFLIDVGQGFTEPYFFPNGFGGAIIGVFTLAGSVALIAFELLVSVLQAYIFTILTAVYISSSIEEH
ncbi:MAG: F0F1 ATP synthase subunit A [Nitriliruptoraceae bacterium]